MAHAPTADVARRMLGLGGGRRGGGHGTFIQRSREKSSEEKAFYHQIAGAGKSHVLRQFFDLSQADIDRIVQRVDEGLDLALRKTP